MSKRQHLEQIEKQTGIRPDEMIGPEVPDELEETLSLYWTIRTGDVLTYQELDAYVRLSGTVLTSQDIQLLRDIDMQVGHELSAIHRSEHGSR